MPIDSYLKHVKAQHFLSVFIPKNEQQNEFVENT